MATEERAVTSPNVNWGAFLDQVARDYSTEPALGLWHGLQKEAIQNSHGARDRQSKNHWACRFRLVESEKGLLLTITDEGTFGLTGAVAPPSADRPDSLPEFRTAGPFREHVRLRWGRRPRPVRARQTRFQCLLRSPSDLL